MITAEHIQQALDRAVRGESNLTEDVLGVKGFTTRTIRKIFNNLCNIDGKYLEIGLFCGASFCASFNKNCEAIGIEDHSQDFSEGFDEVKELLKDNLRKFKYRAKKMTVHYADCFNMDLSVIPNDIDIYFYDGWHSEEHQAKALPHYFDKMADKFLWVIDDYNWSYVESGTMLALNELKDKIEIENVWVLRGIHANNDPIYHNGIALYLINKKK